MSQLAAAVARAAAATSLRDRPRERRQSEQPGTGATCVRARLEVRSLTTVERDGMSGVLVGGFASTTEDPYEMYDMFGAYSEVVSLDAFDRTLAASPLVEFTVNHGAGGGMPMAHTRNGTLDLTAVKDGDTTGLQYEALVDPSRSDVSTMLKALERGDLAEASFKFRIDAGIWSPDYTEFRINAVDLDRGDVSAVNFGANPSATSTLRQVAQLIAKRDLTGSPSDMLAQVLGQLESIDSIVDELQSNLAAALGLPDPDPEEPGVGMSAMAADRPASMREWIAAREEQLSRFGF